MTTLGSPGGGDKQTKWETSRVNCGCAVRASLQAPAHRRSDTTGRARRAVLGGAEVAREAPPHGVLVDGADAVHLCLGKLHVGAHPQDAPDVGPREHVRAVDQDNVTLRHVVQDVPRLVVKGAHVVVHDRRGGTRLVVRQHPGLPEVLQAPVHQEELVRVGVRPRRFVLLVHRVDVLAGVTVPQRVVAPLLPPLTRKRGEGRVGVDVGSELVDRAGHVDGGEGDTVVLHHARHVLGSRVVHVSDPTLRGAVLSVHLLLRRVLVPVRHALGGADHVGVAGLVQNALSRHPSAVLRHTGQVRTPT
eukprot:Hpha_TRINITY_DN14961_c1_g2::TRINITY_DN14961_c1_g2_i1::g.143792::m.143792